MKKIIFVFILGSLFFSCKNEYPKQGDRVSDNTFYAKNGMGDLVEVKFLSGLDSILPEKIFNSMIYWSVSEAEKTLNNPLTYVPARVFLNDYKDETPYNKYSILVEFTGKNGFGVSKEGMHIVTFNAKGKRTNSALRKSEESLMTAQGMSLDEIKLLYEGSDGEPVIDF